MLSGGYINICGINISTGINQIHRVWWQSFNYVFIAIRAYYKYVFRSRETGFDTRKDVRGTISWQLWMINIKYIYIYYIWLIKRIYICIIYIVIRAWALYKICAFIVRLCACALCTTGGVLRFSCIILHRPELLSSRFWIMLLYRYDGCCEKRKIKIKYPAPRKSRDFGDVKLITGKPREWSRPGTLRSPEMPSGDN